MFRSHWTIIREHVVPIPKLPLIVYWYVTVRFCGSDDGPMGPKHVGIILKLILICVEGLKSKRF
jgi:hypothetical protein